MEYCKVCQNNLGGYRVYWREPTHDNCSLAGGLFSLSVYSLMSFLYARLTVWIFWFVAHQSLPILWVGIPIEILLIYRMFWCDSKTSPGLTFWEAHYYVQFRDFPKYHLALPWAVKTNRAMQEQRDSLGGN